jgi:hypothetical protein
VSYWREVWQSEDGDLVLDVNRDGTVFQLRESGPEVDEPDGDYIDRHATFWTLADIASLWEAASAELEPREEES